MSIRQHTFYNFTGALLPLAVSIVTIPLYIKLIGDARYGVLAIAWLLLGYFGLFDLGLGRATAQRMAALGNSNRQQRADTFWTALAMNSTMGIVAAIIMFPVANFFLQHVFLVDKVLHGELAASIPWLIIAVPLAMLSGVFSGALQGGAQFLELNIISVLTSVLIQVAPLTIAWLHGPTLDGLLPAIILARILGLAVLFWRCRVHLLRGHPRRILRSEVYSLLHFGGWVTVTSLISPIMVILDRFLIGAVLGPKAVTYYTVPFQIAERTAIVPAALSSALFPRLAASQAGQAKHLTVTAIRSLAVVMTPLTVTAVLLSEPLIQWWLGREFANNARLPAQILLLSFWVNAFASISYAKLQAQGRPDLVAKCHLAELAPYLFLLYIGMHFWGLPGAAAAFGLRTLLDAILLSRCAGTFREGVAVLYVPVLFLLTTLAIAITLQPGSVIWCSFTAVLFCVVCLWVKTNAPAPIRLLMSQITKKIIMKLSPKTRSSFKKVNDD